jgi:N-ethylmaleimide reductase
MITAGGYTTETAVSAIEAKRADAVAFGRMFIANPDLPQRIRAGVPLNAFDRSTAYGGGAHGSTAKASAPTSRKCSFPRSGRTSW